MKYWKLIVGVFALAILGGIIQNSYAQTVPTLEPWFYTTYAPTSSVITTRTTSTQVQVPELGANVPCIGTNASSVLSTGTCSGGGGSSTVIYGVAPIVVSALSNGVQTTTCPTCVTTTTGLLSTSTAASLYYLLSNPSGYTSSTVFFVNGTAGDVSSTQSGGTVTLDLPTIIGASSCTNCNITYDAKGRITVAANGSGSGGSSTILYAGNGIVLSPNPISVTGTISVATGTAYYFPYNTTTGFSATSSLFYSSSTGNIGIGTNNPGSLLTLLSQSIGQLEFDSASSSKFEDLLFQDTSSGTVSGAQIFHGNSTYNSFSGPNGLNIYNPGEPIWFYAAGNPTLKLASSGVVQIPNVTSSLHLADPNGNITAFGGSTTSGSGNCLTSVTISATGTLSNSNGACSGGGSGTLASTTNWSSGNIAVVSSSNLLASITTTTLLSELGAITGNQTITLTGPVTGSGATTIATTIVSPLNLSIINASTSAITNLTDTNVTTTNLTVTSVTSSLLLATTTGAVIPYLGSSCTAGSVVTSVSSVGAVSCVSTSSILTGYATSTGANPSAQVGTSAVNGSANTFMRSDAAPAINQAATFSFSALGNTTSTGNITAQSFRDLGVTSSILAVDANGNVIATTTPSGGTGSGNLFVSPTSSVLANNEVVYQTNGSSTVKATSSLYNFNDGDLSNNTSTENGNVNFVNTAGIPLLRISTTSVATNTPALNILGASTTATNSFSIFQVLGDGHLNATGTTPVVSSCGTGSPTVVGSDVAGVITTASAATSCTLTFQIPYESSNVMCTATTNSTVGLADISSISNTAVTFGIGSALTSGKIYYFCSENL